MKRLAALLLVLAPSMAFAGAWDIPEEGSCEGASSASPGTPAEDAPPHPFKPGDVISHEQVSFLRAYLPEEVWEHRERFFFDGMRLEIGPCYRDYAAPAFFRDATKRFHGQAKLLEDGSIEHPGAGLPFPPDLLDPNDPQVAAKWAWNWAYRYKAAGAFGDVRLSIVDREAVKARFEGEYFQVLVGGRAERPDDDYRFPAKFEVNWAGGGRTKNMKTGNACAWRQYSRGERKPEFFYWHPEARRVRRGVSPDSEGALQGCLVDVAVGAGLFLHGGSPKLHDWTLVGVRDLLAPINTSQGGYPQVKDRGYGPWGISFADDRWELRRVIVLEGRLREGQFEDGVQTFRWYLDLQTLFPLYYASSRKEAEPGGVGHFVGSWSEDRENYRRWPNDAEREIRVLDRVGAALVDWNDQDAVRVESFNEVSIPPSDKKVHRMMSQGSLRGH